MRLRRRSCIRVAPKYLLVIEATMARQCDDAADRRPRRLANEPGMPGVIHVMDPDPYHYRFGETEEEKVARNPTYLEEVIMYEGPETIAAMFVETVTGTNGIVPPPKGYLQGLKSLLERHGILLVCDEVMCGFGRT